MNLTEGELSMTSGIGWKRAEKIKHLLDEKYSGSTGRESQLKLSESDA
jgi:ERCC4-type nuclease